MIPRPRMHENKLFYERRSYMETGLQGQLKKSQLPSAMGDLFPKRPEADHLWWWKDSDVVSITYLTPEAAAAAVLPSEFSLPRAPVEGLTVATLTFGKYRSSTLGPYNEVFLQVPCLYKGQLYFSGASISGSLERHGVRVASISFKQGNMLYSVPLPTKEKVALSPPFDQMIVLPEPIGRPQGFPFRVATTRFIPDGIAPQHIESLWKLEQGAVWAGEGSNEYAPSDAEPGASLPVVGVLPSILFRGDMACYGGQVLTEME